MQAKAGIGPCSGEYGHKQAREAVFPVLGYEDAQVSLFDVSSMAPRPLVAPDSIYERMRQLGDRLVKDEEFAEYYSDIGRPSVPPAFMSRVMLLAYSNRFDHRV